MQIFVKSLERTIALNVEATADVQTIMNVIAERESIPVEEQRLSFAGKQLQGELALALYGVADNSTLHLSAALLGGAKKKKKKVYTKPTRVAHKKKKVPLAVLKYYRVDGENKITRLRRECPHPECGAGIFMASHVNRQYCGKCGLTYLAEQKA